MPLSIKDPLADQLARSLAEHTGETITQAVINSLKERLAKEEKQTQELEILIEEIMEIGTHCSRLKVLDPRPIDAILEYDQHGLPK